MRILKGVVLDVLDFSHQGKMGVFAPQICSSPLELLPVNYVSPYAGQPQSGMVMIPELEQEVLIVQPEGEEDWYYLGSVYATPGKTPPQFEEVKESKCVDFRPVLPDARIYSDRDYPQRLVIKDPKNNAVTLSHRTSPDLIDISARIRSSKGKELILDDSPEVEAVTLKNEHGDGITITGEKTTPFAKRTTKIENMEGPQFYICRQSAIDMLIQDGRDMNFLNKSVGSNRGEGASPIPEQYGNINIESERRDVYLTAGRKAEGEDGRIMMHCKGRFQVNSEGEGFIQTVDGLNIEVEKGDFNLKVLKGDINLDAVEGNVNINAGGNINMKAATQLNAAGAAAVNMDGKMMYLNSGAALPNTDPLPTVTKDAKCIDNHYETGGE